MYIPNVQLFSSHLEQSTYFTTICENTWNNPHILQQFVKNSHVALWSHATVKISDQKFDHIISFWIATYQCTSSVPKKNVILEILG
jgi:hypothetical protein